MKRNNICRALVAVITVSLLLTGCKGNAAKTTDPSDALLATETTAATEATKATTPKPTTKPATKPSTTKTTKPTGKTDNAKATEATKPAASEPAATQKPTEAPKSNDTPKATEAPKPTNPPATQPPATEAPKPTEPPETEPPVVSLSIDEAISYGRQYIQSLGAILDTGLAYDDPGYYPAGYVIAISQDELTWEVVSAIDSDVAVLRSGREAQGDVFNIAYYRLDVYIERDGDNGFYITVYYG